VVVVEEEEEEKEEEEEEEMIMMMMMMITPERHLPTPGQHGHSPQRHTAAGTAAPHHHRHGEHSPTARQPEG